MKRIIFTVIAVMAIVSAFMAVPALASSNGVVLPNTCSDPSVTTTYDGSTSTTTIPAFTEVVPATEDVWYVFAPNDSHGPFTGTPSYPDDPDGKWIGPKTDGGPEQGTYGVFQVGNGNGDWFYREKGIPESTATVTPEQVITETIEPSSSTEDNPNYPCVTETTTDTTSPSESPSVTVTPVTDTPTPTVTPTVTPTQTPTSSPTPTATNSTTTVGPVVSPSVTPTQPVKQHLTKTVNTLPNTGGISKVWLLLSIFLIIVGVILIILAWK